jgi:iron complex transport system substrate-binding protein
LIRIVSLHPAATEIVAALGAADKLVAVSHECDYPPEITHLPRVTSSAVNSHGTSREIDEAVQHLSAAGLPVFALDAKQLQALAPTVILTQSLCEVCAVSDGDVRTLAEVMDPPPRIVSLGATTLDGVWGDIMTVAEAIGRERAAEGVASSIASRLLAVHQTLKSARAPRLRTAVIEWMDPLFAAGHWTPELVRRGGGIDVLGTAGQHSVRVDVDQVRAATPQLLLFAPCGFDVERSEREARALLATPAWEWARDVNAWALDGNALTSRAGPRLADAVEAIAAIIAPTLFPAPSLEHARRLSG